MRSMVSSSRASITLAANGYLIPGVLCEVSELIDKLVMPVAVQIDQKARKALESCCNRLQQI